MRLFLTALFSLGAIHLCADGTISTIAGASTLDGVVATSTLVNYPGGIAADEVGNVYISDTGNNRIRRVDASTHIITTIAGTGVAGYSGDNGPATGAQFNSPNGLSYVVLGTESYLFVADTGNQRIRRIDLSTGIITTVAGSGLSGYNVNDEGNPAIYGSLDNPKGVYADPTTGNIYIADTSNNRIRLVFGSSGDITTVAGSGSSAYAGDGLSAVSSTVGLNGPETCVMVTGTTNTLYIADTNNFVVRSVNLSTGIISTAAGNGTNGYVGGFVAAGSAEFSPIKGLYESNGILFITDSLNNRVRYLFSGDVFDWFGTSAAGYTGDGGLYYNPSVTINNPGALTVDSNFNVIFVDYSNNCVREVYYATTQDINTIAGSGIQDGVPGTNVVLKDPERVISGVTNTVLIAEQGANKIRGLDLGSSIISTFAGTGASLYAGDGGLATKASFWGVRALTRDPSNGYVYVADNYSQQIENTTQECFTFCFFTCSTICVNIPNGTFRTVGESRLRRIDSLGNITTVAGTNVGGNQLMNTGNGVASHPGAAGIGLIHGLALSGRYLYLSDSFYNVVRRIDLVSDTIGAYGGVSSSGTVGGYAGDGSLVNSGAVQFSDPQGMAVDAVGNLFIADTGNNAIRKVAAGGLTVTTICGLGPSHAGYSGDGAQAKNAALFAPSEVFVDSAGNLFIADSGNSRIRRIDALSNSITTVVGNGFEGFSGDGGPALFAQLNQPGGVYVDPSGSIFTADSGNSRVRKVSYALAPTATPLVSGTGKAAAFPSPASNRICFSYISQGTGNVEIDVYNTAMQLAAKITDTAVPGAMLTCASVSGLANGVYLYRISGAAGNYSPNKFKVIH